METTLSDLANEMSSQEFGPTEMNLNMTSAPPAPQLPKVIAATFMTANQWYGIHITALVSLSISIITSLAVTIYLLFFGEERKTFWKKRISERLVIYLAINDLFYSTAHIADHIYLVSTLSWLPDLICGMAGFLIQALASCQTILVLFTALSAFMLIVKNRMLSTGKFDWKLLLAVYGIPVLCGFSLIYFGIFGRSEMWCHLEVRNTNGRVASNANVVSFITVFIAVVVFYALINVKSWATMKQLRRFDPTAAGNSNLDNRRRANSVRSAHIMTMFVLAFILQCWSYIVYSLWLWFGYPSPEFLMVVVFFSNFGGVFNGCAYTMVRRLYAKASKSSAKETKEAAIGKKVFEGGPGGNAATPEQGERACGDRVKTEAAAEGEQAQITDKPDDNADENIDILV